MTNKQSLSIIGVGSFGRFILPHLKTFFDISIHDAYADLSDIEDVRIVTFAQAAKADIVVLAVPVQVMEDTIKAMNPHIRAEQLIMDVASVKVKPKQWMEQHLPANVNLIGLHPLFGPNSGKNGIAGLNITTCPIRGHRYEEICRFLRKDLKLNVIECDADTHDRDMAYVQGLTHIIAKSFSNMDVPQLLNKTRTYTDLVDMVNLIKNDSDDLFKAIQNFNPYAKDIRDQFFKNVRTVENNLRK